MRLPFFPACLQIHRPRRGRPVHCHPGSWHASLPSSSASLPGWLPRLRPAWWSGRQKSSEPPSSRRSSVSARQTCSAASAGRSGPDALSVALPAEHSTLRRSSDSALHAASAFPRRPLSALLRTSAGMHRGQAESRCYALPDRLPEPLQSRRLEIPQSSIPFESDQSPAAWRDQRENRPDRHQVHRTRNHLGRHPGHQIHPVHHDHPPVEAVRRCLVAVLQQPQKTPRPAG